MVDVGSVLRYLKTARWIRHGAAGVAIGAAFSPLAYGQGGQTEVSKTTPSNPPPAISAPAAPAPVPAHAPSPAATQASPIGAGPGWQAGVAQPPEAAPPATQEATQEADLQVVAKINDYFNKLTDLQGAFIQTDPDGKQKGGRFYFERPGKVRFDYAVPRGLRVVSDGSYVAIEDHDANTSERYPLDVTPFRLLLSNSVNLVNDAKILGVEQGPDTVMVNVEDKKGEVSGSIRLIFNKADMSLKQWIVTDAQGLDTSIEVSDLEQNKKVASNFFDLSRTLGFDHDR